MIRDPSDGSVREKIGSPDHRASVNTYRSSESSDAATRASKPDHHGDQDALFDVRLPEADRRTDGTNDEGSRGRQGLRRDAGCAAARRPGQDVRDARSPLERDVGERCDNAPAGRSAALNGSEQAGSVNANQIQPAPSLIEPTTSGLQTGSSKPENLARLEKSRTWIAEYRAKKSEGT